MNHLTIILLFILLCIMVYMHIRVGKLVPGGAFPAFTIDLSTFTDFKSFVATSFGGLSNGGYLTVTGNGYYALTPVGYNQATNSFQDIIITIYLASPPTNPVLSLRFSDFTPISLQYGPSIPLQLGSLNDQYTYNVPNGIYSYNLINVKSFVDRLNSVNIPFYTVVDLGRFTDFNNFIHNPNGATQEIANTIADDSIPVTLKLGSYLTNATKVGNTYVWNNFTITVNGVDYNLKDYFENVQLTWNLSSLANPDTDLKLENLPMTLTYGNPINQGNLLIQNLDVFSQNLAAVNTWISMPISGVSDFSIERTGVPPLASGCLYTYCAYADCVGGCRDADESSLNCMSTCPSYQGCDNLFRSNYINSNFIASLDSQALNNGTC